MALEIGFGQGPDVGRGDLAKLDASCLDLTFDDFEGALPDQGSDEAGGSW